jgi:hypothetical protein
MGKIINLLLALFNLLPLLAATDEDVINITKIKVFPKDYNSSKIRAGYLSITPYTQSYYYILVERYLL